MSHVDVGTGPLWPCERGLRRRTPAPGRLAVQAGVLAAELPAARLAVAVHGPNGRCHHPFIPDSSAP